MVVLGLSTVSLFVVLGLAFLLFIVLIKLASGRKKGKGPPPVLDPTNITIKDARVGDIVTVSGFGDEFDDVDFVIEKRNRYESGGEEWYELLGVYKGRQVWIEWSEDDALEIVATSPDREVKMSTLNITEDDLIRMDEEESAANYVEWEGRKFFYRESCEAGFFEDCSDSGEGFYLWDFEGEDGDSRLTVEKWEGEPFTAFTGRVIRPYNVKVYKR